MLHYFTYLQENYYPKRLSIRPNCFRVVLYRLTSAKFSRPWKFHLYSKFIDLCSATSMCREQDILPILKTIESFYRRRVMCQINKNRDTSLFGPLHSNVMQLVTHENRSYPEALEIELMENKRTSRFPTTRSYEKNSLTYNSTPPCRRKCSSTSSRCLRWRCHEGEQHKEILEKFENLSTP